MSHPTYQIVAKICNQLKLSGDKPSVRKIREKTGGSFTVIAENLKKWRGETELAESSDMMISEEFQKAILAEFVQIKMQAQLALQSTIDEKEIDLEDARKALTEYEIKCRQQEVKLDEIKCKLHNDTLEFEKKLAACESTVSFLKDREIELQKKCAAANEKAHQAEVQTAVANTKADNFQNRIKEMEQQLKERSK